MAPIPSEVGEMDEPLETSSNTTRSVSVHVYRRADGNFALQVWRHRWGNRRPTSLRNAWGPPIEVHAPTFQEALRAAAEALWHASKDISD